VVIAGQLDRTVVDIHKTATARDVTYGLFTIPFVAFMAIATPSNSKDDTLVSMKDGVEEETRTWIVQTLSEMTQNGTKTAPAFTSLLDTLKTETESDGNFLGRFNPPPPPGRDLFIRQEMAKMKLSYIAKLRARFADWEPINRWQGASPAVEEPLSES